MKTHPLLDATVRRTFAMTAQPQTSSARRGGHSQVIGAALLGIALVSLAGTSSAANKFWAGPSGSAASPVSGTWDTSAVNWSTTAGGSAAATFSSGDTATFGGADGVFIKCSPLTSGIITNNNSYTFTNDTPVIVGLAGGTPWMIGPGKTVTIGTNVTFAFNGSSGGTINVNNLAFGGTIIIDNGGALQQTSNQPFQFDGNGTLIRVLTGGLFQHAGTGSNFRLAASSGHSATLSVEGGLAQVSGTAGCLIAANANSTATINIFGGLFSVTNNPLTLGSGGAATCVATNNLNGGIELVRQIKTSSALNVSVFNFNGGTLKAGSAALGATFMNGLTAANVRNAASTIDNNGYSIGIAQALQHSTLAGDSAVDGGLIFTGSGTTTNAGASTYNGPTVVAAGTLVITPASTGGGAYAISNGATLQVQVPVAGVSLNAASLTLGTTAGDALTNNFSLGANASTSIPAVNVTGPMNLNGTVTVSVFATGLTAPNSYVLMNYGSVTESGSFVAGTLPAVSGFLATLVNDTSAKQLKLVYSAAPQPVKWASGDGNWDTTALNWVPLAGGSPTTYVEGSPVIFDDSSSGNSPVTVTLAAARSPSSISNNAAKTYVLAGGASVAGTSPLTKNGSGVFILDNGGANNFAAVSIGAGTLQLGNNDTGGSLGSAGISNSGTLALSRTDNFTLNNVLSGPGALVQKGSDNVTLPVANTHSGPTVVNSGTLIVANSGALQNSTVSNNVPGGVMFANGLTTATFGALSGAGDISLLNAGSATVSLTVGGNGDGTVYTGTFSGSGNLLKAGTNVLTLTGNNTLNNLQVTAPGSTLAISGGNTTMSALQIVTDNGSLLLSGGNTTVALDARLAGANGVFTVSGGILNLPKVVIGSASAANTNNLMSVSGSAQVYQNQPGGSPAQALWVGGNNSGSGALVLRDNATWVNNSAAAGIVVIGNNGTGQGTLTVQDAASFTYQNVVRVADTAGNIGTINLNGGNVSVTGFSKGLGAGTINIKGGQITALAANPNFFAGFGSPSGTNAVNLVSGMLVLENSGSVLGITNTLSGSGGLASQGPGTLTLSASNAYTGPTMISSGALVLTGAGSINSSSSLSNNSYTTLDISTASTPLSIAGSVVLNDSTLIMSLAATNVSAGTFGTAGSANTINITALPAVDALPKIFKVIKYTTAAPGLVDANNQLVALGVILPPTGSPQGYLTNNVAAKSIDLVITDYLLPPVISVQPAGDSAYAGGKAHFTVQLLVTNLAGVQYQWRKAGTLLSDGGNVAGATNATVRLSNISMADAASYDVVITNNFGAVTSTPALLTYLVPTNYEAAAVAAGPASLHMLQELADPATGMATAFDYEGDFDGVYGIAAQNGYNGVTGPRPSDGFPGFDESTTAAGFSGFVPESHVVIPPLNLNTNTVTLAAWIRPGSPAANAGVIFCRGNGTVAGLNFTGGTDPNGYRSLGYTWNNDGATYNWNSQIAPLPGIWSYVALVVTPTNATIYILNANGLLSAVNTFNHVNQGFSTNSWIGEDPFSGQRQMDGSVYGAAIYAKALTKTQVAGIYGAASGVSNFPPVIQLQPATQTWYAQQTATFSGLAGGSDTLAYQWQFIDSQGNYSNVANGGRVSGATSSTLVISNLAVADATNFALVVTNYFGSVTSVMASLVVDPVGPAEFITNSVVETAGNDWNTAAAWSDGLPASSSAISKPGSAYFIVPGGALRTPNVGSLSVFPGMVLTNLGDGTFSPSLPSANAGALVLKGSGSAYPKLVLDGGEVLSFTDNNGDYTLGGGDVVVLKNTPIAGLSSTGGRSITINARLSGNGSIQYIGWPNASFQPNATTALNIAGTNNTFSGTWAVDAGTLVGSTPGALGTNSITVSANAALQTTYDLNAPGATLTLNGRMYLTQNDTFSQVTINGTSLNGGTYSHASLAAAFPANFPASWTGITGSGSLTNAGGSITVLTYSIPTNAVPILFGFGNGVLSMSWPPDHKGWILQSNGVSLTAPAAWTDVPASGAVTNWSIPVAAGVTKAFYRLRYPN